MVRQEKGKRETKQMNMKKLLGLLLPMWAFFFSLFLSTLVAKPDTDISFVFGSLKKPISQFSAEMEAESPGVYCIHPSDFCV